MGDESVGATCPDPYRLVLDLGRGDLGVPLLCCARRLSAIFCQTERICGRYFTGRRRAHTCACAQTLADSAAVSLDHGRLHVHTTVYRLPAESWRSVSLGDLSLDRGRRLDGFHSLSHHPCVLLYGLLGDLA